MAKRIILYGIINRRIFYFRSNIMTHGITKTFFVVCCLIVLACNNTRSISKEEESKIRDRHKVKLTFMRIGADPYSYKVPDSMKHWVTQFAEIMAEDQKYRISGLRMNELERKEQAKIDSINLVTVTGYLDKYGWPRLQESGLVAQNAVGMVIQHAPLRVQEKYFPMLTRSYEIDSTLSETVAMLEDRINVTNKKLQYYGTQVMLVNNRAILYPVVNVDSLDVFRSKLGPMVPFSSYIAIFDKNWSADKYKKGLPRLKKKLNFSDAPGIHFVRSTEQPFTD